MRWDVDLTKTLTVTSRRPAPGTPSGRSSPEPTWPPRCSARQAALGHRTLVHALLLGAGLKLQFVTGVSLWGATVLGWSFRGCPPRFAGAAAAAPARRAPGRTRDRRRGRVSARCPFCPVALRLPGAGREGALGGLQGRGPPGGPHGMLVKWLCRGLL